MTSRQLGLSLWLGLLMMMPACSDDVAAPDAGPTDRGAVDVGKVPENTEARCKDNQDNDRDGHTDCADQDCSKFDFCKKKDAGPDSPLPVDKGMDKPPAEDMLPVDLGPDVGLDSTVVADLEPDTTSKPDSVVKPDAVLKADSGVKAPLPGCPQGCLDSEVCLKGACVEAGPSKACGAGPWEPGLGSNTIYVNGAHVGVSDGSKGKPWRTIKEALAAVSTTASIIAVAAGTYNEDLFIHKQVALRCRCPSMVTISGRVEIHHLGSSSLDVTVDGCRVLAPDSSATPKTWGVCSAASINMLQAVWGSSPKDVLVASKKGEILRYDGLRWSAMTSGTTAKINAGWGNTPAGHVAVADGGLALHFDGKVWSNKATPTTNNLRGVWGSSATSVFAVGDAGTVLHFDGKSWTKHSVPTVDTLFAVWGATTGEVFAVGAKGAALRYKGGKWSKVTSSFSNDFSAIWGASATDVFAVGVGGKVLRFDGTSWKVVYTSTSALHGVWAAAGGDAFAVGDSGTIVRFDGKSWTPQTTGIGRGLSSVWGNSASDVFAAGEEGTVIRFNGKAWTDLSDGTPQGIRATTGAGQLNVLVRHTEVIGWCAGLNFSAQPSSLSTLCLTNNRFYANSTGVDVETAPTINMSKTGECQNIPEAVGSRLSLVDQNREFGILTREGAMGVGLEANLIKRSGRLGSKVSKTRGYGVYFGNVESSHVFSNVVRDNENRGVGMRTLPTLQAKKIAITNNAVYSNRGAGIALQQVQAQQTVTISGNWLRDTKADTKAVPAKQGGDGIQVSVDKGAKYNVSISNNTVDKSLRHGIFLDTAGGAATKNKISNNGGFGVVFQQSAASESSNTIVGNAKGKVSKPGTPVNKYGDLPVPMP